MRRIKDPAYLAGVADGRQGRVVLEETDPHFLDPQYWNGLLDGSDAGQKEAVLSTGVTEGGSLFPPLPAEEDASDSGAEEEISESAAEIGDEEEGEIACDGEGEGVSDTHLESLMFTPSSGHHVPPVFDDRDGYGDDRMQLDANRYDKKPTRFPKAARWKRKELDSKIEKRFKELT